MADVPSPVWNLHKKIEDVFVALVRIVRCVILKASYQLPGIVWNWKSVRPRDGMRGVSEDVIDNQLHDSRKTDKDDRSEELTDISCNCTQLQREVLQELEERGKRRGEEEKGEREGERCILVFSKYANQIIITPGR